jgi:SOS-response transcriptional repressor LexA
MTRPTDDSSASGRGRFQLGDARYGDDDALLRLAMELAWEDLDPDDPANAPFFEWLAREARERQTPEERAETAAMARALSRRWTLRHLSESLRVALREGAPVMRAMPGDGTFPACVHEGRRTGCVPTWDSRAAAGAGRTIGDEPCEGWIERPSELAPGDYAAIRVAGDSMTPLLHDGDTIVLKPGTQARPNTVVVVRLPEDGCVVKKVAAADRHFLELASLNEAYPAITVARGDAAVLGTVVLRWCPHDG